MSYNEDNYESPYNQYKTNRNRINVNLFTSDYIKGYFDKRWCDVCQTVLIPKKDDAKSLWCKSCGHSFPIQQPIESKITSKFQQADKPNTIIQSKQSSRGTKRKNSRIGVNAELTDEDLDELRRYGFAI